MYSSSLCSHVNNIYSKLSELQRQIQHHCMHMNQGDTVQIEAPDFDPDIDGVSSPSTDEKSNELMIQGTLSSTPEVTKPEDDNSLTTGTNIQQLTSQIGQTLSPCKFHKSLHQQPSQKNKDLSEARPDITLKVLKFLNWRKILRRNNLSIWIHIWHITTHTKLVNIYNKNTDPVYMTWMTISITLRSTGCTIHRIHQLHRTISWQTNQQNHEDLQKSLKEYLVEAEVKPGEKSCTVIDHLAQELVPYKIAFSARSRRISDYAKGMLITVNDLMP